jgi:hypothetical protein
MTGDLEDPMDKRCVVWILLAWATTAGACFWGPGDRDADEDCLDACEAENACPGSDDTNCDGLCGAVPDDCRAEISGYWDCAATHLDEACSSYSSCASEFSELTVCVGVYCLLHPLDTACYYLE